MELKNRSFLKLLDYTPAEIGQLLELAADLKAKKKAGIRHDQLRGKNIALIFEKTSTRTRCSFEVAAHDLGMEVTYLDPSGSQIGKKESIADTARVLGRMFDGIEYRGYGQQIVEDLAHYAGVPVWNGLTNEFHPTQILADFLTIQEHFGHLKGIHFVYFGDARYNMGNSLMVGCAKMGLHFTACAPKKYQPDPALVEQCQAIAAQTGATLSFEEDPVKAAKGADALYTDVLGIHGRTRRGLGGAHPRSGSLSDQSGSDEYCRPGCSIYALPARLPRPQDRWARRWASALAAMPWR